jgi:hypothetical protein
MKRRTKAEMAAYQKQRRHAMTLKKCNTPVTPFSVPCPDCAALSLEVKTLLAKIAQLEAQVNGKAQDDASLNKRVVAGKLARISTYSTGHTIGTARTM